MNKIIKENTKLYHIVNNLWQQKIYILFSIPLLFISIIFLIDIYQLYNDSEYIKDMERLIPSTELGWAYRSKLNYSIHGLMNSVIGISIFVYLLMAKYSILKKSLLVITATALVVAFIKFL